MIPESQQSLSLLSNYLLYPCPGSVRALCRGADGPWKWQHCVRNQNTCDVLMNQKQVRVTAQMREGPPRPHLWKVLDLDTPRKGSSNRDKSRGRRGTRRATEGPAVRGGRCWRGLDNSSGPWPVERRAAFQAVGGIVWRGLCVVFVHIRRLSLELKAYSGGLGAGKQPRHGAGVRDDDGQRVPRTLSTGGRGALRASCLGWRGWACIRGLGRAAAPRLFPLGVSSWRPRQVGVWVGVWNAWGKMRDKQAFRASAAGHGRRRHRDKWAGQEPGKPAGHSVHPGHGDVGAVVGRAEEHRPSECF